MAEQGSNSNELQPLMAKLLEAFHEEDDRELLHRAELDKIFAILDANKDKIASQPPELEKKEELAELLRKIDEALQQCKARSKQLQPAAKGKKTMMSSVSDCNPFKPRPPPPPPPLSVEPLLRQTIDILGDAPAPLADVNAGEVTEFYEWTTSYVDVDKIYGWRDEANKVVDALVGVKGEDEVMFRAAGIAGIHGSGKTALAQLVFVHDRIKDAFPLRLWVCVGPPDNEDRFCLLYRMLDNLGLDTDKIEDIVSNSGAVKGKDSEKEKEKSKIGVLLFILYVTLYKTGYLIVFDDIRTHGCADEWYNNLTLPPPMDSEWYERLAYGLPKARKSAVLVTCRSEDDARAMVRTGGVFRPPKLGTDEGWQLFMRKYDEAKTKGKDGKKEEEDKLYKELEEMKEEIVRKCLGLPVAIVEAAKGFALLEYEPPKKAEAEAEAAADETATSKIEPAQLAETNQSAAN